VIGPSVLFEYRYDNQDDKCPDLERVFEEVITIIPATDLQEIHSVCQSVVYMRGGSAVAAFSPADKYLSRLAAPVTNRCHTHRLETGATRPIRIGPKHIRACIWDLGQFSSRGQHGVIAHELGHAFDFAATGVKICRADRDQLEVNADLHASRWGFSDELIERDNERERIY
jgi:hypothetical protein